MSKASLKPKRQTSHQSRRRVVLDIFWRWFIEPSPDIIEKDRRRLAALLSILLLSLMAVGIFIEAITIPLINQPNYTGYQDTLVAIIVLLFAYGVSRTQYLRLASMLSILIVMVAIFATGWSQPYGVLGGLFDYLILPLWLGSLYLSLTELVILLILEIVGLIIFPLISPGVTYNDILVGPFSFVLLMSVTLIVLTWHRNLLEQDRREELVEREKQSHRQAARAEALLRVADRLNAQLDLDTLLAALSEEVARALHTPIAVVLLYDPKLEVFELKAAEGRSTDSLHGITPLPRVLYEQIVKEFGPTFAVSNLNVFTSLQTYERMMQLELRSLAFSTMVYDGEIIGSLSALTVGESRDFSSDERMLLQGLAAQGALAITNTRLYKDARRRLDHLQALRAIDIAISANHNLQETLDVLLEQITKELQVDAAVILLLEETRQQLEFGASRGFQTTALQYAKLRVGEGMAGLAASAREIVRVHDLREDPKTLINVRSLLQEGFVSYFAAPLITQGQVKGVLEIFHRSLLDPDHEWLHFLETLAGQAAIAIENTTLFEDLQRTNEELLNAYDSTIEGWSRALDLRDKETEGHTQRVTEFTLRLAQAFNFSERDLIYIRWGALLHDIGKMGVPDRILLKEGPLTEQEWEVMRQHPVYAHEMLRTIQYLRPALDIPYCHHEKWDGTGYPRGLQGDQIPLAARLFAVVDVWDALRSDRPYRAAWPVERVLEHIQSLSGTHFDPQILEVFLQIVDES